MAPKRQSIFEELGIFEKKDIDLLNKIISNLSSEEQEIIRRYHELNNLSNYELNAYKKIFKKVKDTFQSQVRRKVEETIFKINMDESLLRFSSFDFDSQSGDSNKKNASIDYKTILINFISALLKDEKVIGILSDEEYNLIRNFCKNGGYIPQTDSTNVEKSIEIIINKILTFKAISSEQNREGR